MTNLIPSDVDTFLKNYGSTIRILVIGEGGSGRSSLVNNLLGEEPPDDISEPGFARAPANIITRQSKEYPVVFHEATGEVQYNESDQEYFTAIQSLVQDEKPAIVVLCLKLNETRIRTSIIRFIKEHHKAGINWRTLLIALTFADSISIPRSVRQQENWDEGEYFNDRVKMWSDTLRTKLVTEVGILDEAVRHIPMTPTSSLSEDKLANQKQWYTEFWQCLVDVVKAHPSTDIAHRNQASTAAAQPLPSDELGTTHHDSINRTGPNSVNAGVNDAEDNAQAEPTVRLIDKESASFSSRTSATGNENGEQHFSGDYHSEITNADAKSDTNRACCKCKCCNIL